MSKYENLIVVNIDSSALPSTFKLQLLSLLPFLIIGAKYLKPQYRMDYTIITSPYSIVAIAVFVVVYYRLFTFPKKWKNCTTTIII